MFTQVPFRGACVRTVLTVEGQALVLVENVRGEMMLGQHGVAALVAVVLQALATIRNFEPSQWYVSGLRIRDFSKSRIRGSVPQTERYFQTSMN